ncbi:Asparagine--tRNA ligase, cytoplasmic [Cyphellophora attinorum]|uniref:Asparagine--tRNA ligase, cytoplasmic n=1 Tax=Cyphellophora attinorum TaxID=1664694 RepID=A0A0N1NZ91_9EURO|nr:Asparagine--tRNA ligase, cytoplasmic [Phialophora attinorum]KPI39867.1 Asparagine--tRNA ligase, cytoplasmic [Phialophora attinorum]
MADQQIYVDDGAGNDDTATGAQDAPYRTLLQAMIAHPDASYQTRKDEAGSHQQTHKKKQAKAGDLAVREKAEADKRQAVLEDAKKVVLTEDKSLPEAVRIRLDDTDANKIKLGTKETPGTRVKVLGRVHHLRSQKDVTFVTLKDGYGSCKIKGQLMSLPEGAHAPLQRELHADFFTVIGVAVGDKEAITNKVQQDGDIQTLLDNRHLVLRGENASQVMKVRAAVLRAFRKAYEEARCLEVTPPAIVQTSVEGGATLFSFNYYGQTAT